MRPHLTTWVSIIVLVGAAIGFTLFQQSPERVLRRKLARLAKLVEKTSPEKPLAAMNRLRQIGDFFTAEVELAPGTGLPTRMGRQDVMFFVQHARASLRTLRIRIREQEISLSPDRTTALAHVVVEVTAQHEAEKVTEVREGIVEWKRNESDEWQIHRLKAADTIQNPALRQTGIAF